MSETRSGDEWPSDGLERVAECPVCADTQRVVLYAGLTDRDYRCASGSWTLWTCQGCGAAYLDPRPTRDSIALAYTNYYEDAPDPRERLQRSSAGHRKFRRAIRNGYLSARFRSALTPASGLGPTVMRFLPRQRQLADRAVMYLQRPREHASLLDVGCGDGSFLLLMQAAGWTVMGIDPSRDAAVLAQRAGLDVRPSTLEADDLPKDWFDAVTMSRVLELLHDPVEALTTCKEILRPNGVIALATPNLSSQGHALFRDDWLLLSPPRSLVLFTPESLIYALKRAGLEPISFFPARTTGWTYRLSVALAAGAAPFDNPPPLAPRLRLKAWIAEQRATRDPLVGEELILIARRPAIAATS